MPKHSKSDIYPNHSKTSTDIPSGYEYVAEQIQFAQSYVKKLDAYKNALQSKRNKSRDRGGKGTLRPSADFAGTREFPMELIQNKAKANKKKYIS